LPPERWFPLPLLLPDPAAGIRGAAQVHEQQEPLLADAAREGLVESECPVFVSQ